jgi:hypothetical protein
MQEYTALIGAYVRSYAEIKVEAISDEEVVATAIVKFKVNERDMTFHETDWENIALPSIVSLERLPDHQAVTEGHDFALNETDARDLHARELLDIATLIAEGSADIDALQAMAVKVLADINAACPR